MTDLHTHILPGMDDGARNTDESIAMLRMERMQGVDTVVLTPHFYCEEETVERFLRRRAKSYRVLTERLETLPKEEREGLPRMVLGAEVAWNLNLLECDQLPLLCIEGTKNMLFEMPFIPWNGQIFRCLYNLIGHMGIVPVIAHLERHIKMQKPEFLAEVFDLGVPIQISGDILQRPLVRGKVIKLLEKQCAHLLASDCHDCTKRPPNLEPAMQVVRRKLGDWYAEELMRSADELAGKCT